MNVTHVGGTFTCSSDLPGTFVPVSWLYYINSPKTADTEDTPCHNSVEMPKSRKRLYAMSSLQSRQDTVPNSDKIKPADDRDIPKYLKYSASGPNLVSTEEIVHWDDQYSRMVQLNELRLLGYDWERVRGRNNKGGTQEYTETLSVTEGIERSRSSSSRVSVDFNFQVSFPYGSAGVSASAAQEFFESQKSDVVSQKTINIKVDPGHAQFIYQQVYTWETQAWFRWEVYDWSGKIRGKDSTGNWTISAKRRNVPLTAKSVSYIKTDNLVILNKALHGQGTFDVAEDWKIVEPLYPRTNLVKIAETGGREKDLFRRLGFKNEE